MANWLELEEIPAPGSTVGDGYVVDDQSWLGSAHGTDTAESILLDGPTCLARFPDGIVPSGTCLGKITATGKYGPYALVGQVSVTEQQTVRVTNATSGTFTLSFRGETTDPIQYNASAATVVAALEALPEIGMGNVTGSGGPVNTTNVTLTFAGALADADVPQLTGNSDGLTSPYTEVQSIAVNATAGDFTLTFRGQTTAAIAYNASAATVEAALEALPNVAPADVTCTGGALATNPVVVTFGGVYAGQDQPTLYATPNVSGGAATVTVTTTTEGGGQGPTPTLTINTTTPGLPPGGTDGLETFVGHLFTTRSVTPHGATVSRDTPGALFWHGKVIVSKLPPNSGYTDDVASAAKFIRYV